MKKTGNFSVCKLEADAFFNVAKSCTDNLDTFILGQMYPFAVNIALACELYMKAIMIHESKSAEYEPGHNLKALFEKLEPSTQNAITLFYTQRCSTSLRDLLIESATAFTDWRYAMETNVLINVDGMLSFAESLKMHIENTCITSKSN